MDSKKLIYIFVGLLVVCIVFLIIVGNSSSKTSIGSDKVVTTYSFHLKGANKITLEEGDSFKDPGYEAIDSDGFTVNGVVQTEGTVNTNVPGKYTIKYIVNGEVEATREVVVLSKDEDKDKDDDKDKNKDIEFKLNGDEEMNVLINTEFVDPLYIATGKNDKDYTDSVKVSGSVNTNKKGTYTLKYTLKTGNFNETLTRTVKVVELEDVEFSIKGGDKLTIQKGTKFEDPGVVATYNGKDYSSSVKKSGKVDSSTLGDYEITYTFTTKDFSATLTRTITVIEEEKIIDFHLNGEINITIDQDSAYSDPGFVATDQFNNDYRGYVTIENYLDTSTPGTYKILFKLNYEDSKMTLTRTITVKAKSGSKPASDKKEIKFYLNGQANMVLSVNTSFTDPGFVASDGTNNYNDFVFVSGGVNTKKVGTYTLTYTLNYEGTKKTLTRTVVVQGSKYSVNQVKNNNNTVTINITSNTADFGYFIDPKLNKLTSKTISYTVTKNDTYIFLLCDKSGTNTVISVKVTSITNYTPTPTPTPTPEPKKDTTPPKGNCYGQVVTGGITKYYVYASDESGIESYTHNGKKYTNSTFSVKNDVEDDTVRVTDKAGNYKDIQCVYQPIVSKTNAAVDSYSSDTLKYWVEKPTNTYSVTHIWVKDAYKQMNVEVNTTMGTLETTKTILDNTISKYHYSNKGIVAANASGFIMNSGDSYENYVKAYKLSSRAPVIFTRGNLVRNFTSYTLPNAMYPVYSLKSNGYMTYYTFNGGANNINGNKSVVSQMKKDGVRNTFSFTPVLVDNYKSVSSATDNNIRQAICQIDRNNFVIITNTSKTRSIGWNFKALSSYMVSLNCRYGFNMDGGGSTNFYYKKNNGTIYNTTTSSRRVADIIYFVEQ